MPPPTVRRQDPYIPLTKDQFRERFYARFYDPAFDEVRAELEKVFEKAWDGYIVYRKSPRKQPAGPGYADPEFKLPVEWLQARARIEAADKRQKDPASRRPRSRPSNRSPTTKSISSTSPRSPTSPGR